MFLLLELLDLPVEKGWIFPSLVALLLDGRGTETGMLKSLFNVLMAIDAPSISAVMELTSPSYVAIVGEASLPPTSFSFLGSHEGHGTFSF